jgi:N-acetylglucosamine-6-sulfatase
MLHIRPMSDPWTPSYRRPCAPAVALLGLAAAVAAACAPSSHPVYDFVVLVTDDQNVDTTRFMPILRERLAAEGTTFRNAFVTVTACCPSRASILRGQYPQNHGVWVNEGPQGGFQMFRREGLDRSTLAVWLSAVGYRTGLAGKYFNSYPRKLYVPPGWTYWLPFWHTGYEQYGIFDEGTRYEYGGQEPGRYYSTDVLAERAVSFIEKSVAEGKPFLLYLVPYAVHKPSYPALRHQGLFADQRAPRTPNFNEADVSDKPGWVARHELIDEKGIAEIDALYRNQLEALQSVDEMVGAILDVLERTGRLERTFFFYSSDSGFRHGQHRLHDNKRGPYEESIRTPFIVRGPGVAPGVERDEMVLHTDIAPTVAVLARAEPQHVLDGRSLVPLLLGGADPPPAWRRNFLVRSRNQPAHGYSALRMEHSLFVRYGTGEREYYDLREDPYQLENRAASLEPARLRRLEAHLDAFEACAGQACRDLERLALD